MNPSGLGRQLLRVQPECTRWLSASPVSGYAEVSIFPASGRNFRALGILSPAAMLSGALLLPENYTTIKFYRLSRLSMRAHSQEASKHHVALVVRLIGALAATTLVHAVQAQTLASRSDWAAIAKWPQFMGGVWGGRGAGGPEVGPIAQSAPLKPDIQAKFALSGPSPDQNSGSRACIPDGIPIDVGGEFYFSRGRIFLLSDLDFFVARQIDMTRKDHGDPDPSYYGDSIGHWEGSTLVVDTVGFLPEVGVVQGVPGGGSTHVIERFKLKTPDEMQYTRTVINPDVLTTPWVTTRILPRHRDWHVYEAWCTQNNRDAPVEGKAHLDLTPPAP
jgi:hypothetical protein